MKCSNWTRVRLVKLGPSNNPHACALDEVIESLIHGFSALGSYVDCSFGEFIEEGTNVVFFANLLSDGSVIPANSILYNFEQIFEESPLLTPAYLALLGRFPVWDYSGRNLSAIRRLTRNQCVQRVPIGYAPALSRIACAPAQDIDVLFYGSINPRRAAIFRDLRAMGLVLHTLFGVYGNERDAFIARAKVVLNLHFYAARIFETVRVSYLISNRKAVVSECDDDTEIDPEMKAAIVAVPYERVVDACVDLVVNEGKRRELEARGFETIRAFDIVEILRMAIAGEVQPVGRATID